MLGNLLLALVGFGLAGFMVNRLYVGLGGRQINVKGITYSRSSTPIMYWIVMAMAVFGLCFGLLIGGAGAMLILE
ncbi:hypothetical protein [Sphingomonas azotifigens]|uniref:hypothetical protein n=1 Tax=Sphingomonas azotifigens TaxID=330920 RepID=UPI001C3F7F62|nr:hypothetical protein [Sphingomonas azotifigens]